MFSIITCNAVRPVRAASTWACPWRPWCLILVYFRPPASDCGVAGATTASVGSPPLIKRSGAGACTIALPQARQAELRPLPSTGVTRLPRYYEPLRHPKAPGLSLAVLCSTAKLTRPGPLRVIFVRSTRSRRSRHVRFAPIASEPSHRSESPRCAKSGCEHPQRGSPYSITASARASRPGGMVRPMARAVLRLITSSNLVDCRTGRSAGLAPLRIRAAYTPTWRNASRTSVP
jgi:hypothetical protein